VTQAGGIGAIRATFNGMTVSKLALSARLILSSAGILVASTHGAFAFQATADQQSNAKSDRDLTQKIRKSIVADKSLSSAAHNVKVVVRGGQVTLAGAVKSDDEKKSIEAKAAEAAGAGNVTDNLTVAAQ
jgi:osmotically-inducible protein OsmY